MTVPFPVAVCDAAIADRDKESPGKNPSHPVPFSAAGYGSSTRLAPGGLPENNALASLKRSACKFS